MGSPQCVGRALMVFGFLELLAGGALVAAGIRQVFNQSRYYIYYHGIWAGAIICLAGVFAVCGGGNVSRKGYSTAHLIFAIVAALGAAPALITLSFFEAKSDSVGYYWSDPEYCYYKCSPQQYLKENINAIVQNAFDSSGDPYLNFFQRGKRQLVAMGAPMGFMDGFYNTTTTVPASMDPALLQTVAAAVMGMPEPVQPNYAYPMPDDLMQYYSDYNQTTIAPDMTLLKMTMGLAPYPLPAVYPYPINQSETTILPDPLYPLPPIYAYNPINQSGAVNYSSAAYPNVYYPNAMPDYLKQYYSAYNQTTTTPDMSLRQMTMGLAPYPLPAIYPYPINQSATTSFLNPIYPGAMNYSNAAYPAVGLAYPLPAFYPYVMINQSSATSLPMPVYPADIYNYSTPPYAYAINPVIGMPEYLYPYYGGLYNQTTPAGYYDWTPNIMADYFPMPNDTLTPSWPMPYPGLYPNDTLAALSWNMTNPNFNLTDPAVMMKLMQGMLNAGITPDDWNGTDPTMMPMIMMMMNEMLSGSNSTVAPTTTTEAATSTTTAEATATNQSPTKSITEAFMPSSTTRARTTTRPRTTTTKKPTTTTRRRTSLPSTTTNLRMQTSGSQSIPAIQIKTTTTITGTEGQMGTSAVTSTTTATETTTGEAFSSTTTPPDTSTSTTAPTESPSMPTPPVIDTAAPRKIIPMQLAASTTPERIQTPTANVPTRASSGSATPAKTTTSAKRQSTSARQTPGTTRRSVPPTTTRAPSSTVKRTTTTPLPCGPLGCTTARPPAAVQQNLSTKARSPSIANNANSNNNAAITGKPRSGADAKTNVFKCRYNPCPNWPAWKIEMGEIIVGAGMILFFLISAALAISLISTTPKSAVYPVSNGMWYMAADTQPVFIPSPYGEYSSTAAIVSIQPPRIATV